jgi:putative flippase GtrA
VAAICALLHIAIMELTDRAGWDLLLSTALSFTICTVIGYTLHTLFTFRGSLNAVALARYAGAMSANFPLSVFIMWLLHECFGLPMILAAGSSTILLTLYNYFSSRWAIIRFPGAIHGA